MSFRFLILEKRMLICHPFSRDLIRLILDLTHSGPKNLITCGHPTNYLAAIQYIDSLSPEYISRPIGLQVCD